MSTDIMSTAITSTVANVAFLWIEPWMSTGSNVALYCNSSLSVVNVACTRTSHCYKDVTYNVITSRVLERRAGARLALTLKSPGHNLFLQNEPRITLHRRHRQSKLRPNFSSSAEHPFPSASRWPSRRGSLRRSGTRCCRCRRWSSTRRGRGGRWTGSIRPGLT